MVNEWISVKDKLPNNCDKVLCRLEFNETVCAMYNGKFFMFQFQSLGVSESYLPAVTHWMIEPEPPVTQK